MNSLVSVVIPSLNRFDYLLNAVESVQNQSYKNYEILIINDNSDDERYYNYEFPSNVKLIHFNEKKETLSGPGSIRNFGIENAKGKFIAFLDDDDIWMKNKLELQLKVMEENNFRFSSTEGYFGEGIYNPEYKYPLYNKEKFYKRIKSKYKGTNYFKKGYPEIWDFEFLKIHNCVITSSVVVEKKLITTLGGFRPIPDGVEDYDCWLGLLRHTNLIYVDIPLFYYDSNHGEGRNY